MDKHFEAIQFLQRVLLAVCISLIAFSLSTERRSTFYRDTVEEFDNLIDISNKIKKNHRTVFIEHFLTEELLEAMQAYNVISIDQIEFIVGSNLSSIDSYLHWDNNIEINDMEFLLNKIYYNYISDKICVYDFNAQDFRRSLNYTLDRLNEDDYRIIGLRFMYTDKLNVNYEPEEGVYYIDLSVKTEEITSGSISLYGGHTFKVDTNRESCLDFSKTVDLLESSGLVHNSEPIGYANLLKIEQVHEMTPGDAKLYLANKTSEERSEFKGSVNILGIEVNSLFAFLIAPVFVLFIQFSIYLHLKNLISHINHFNNLRNGYSFPWIGLYEDKLSITMYYCVIGFLPIASIISALYLAALDVQIMIPILFLLGAIAIFLSANIILITKSIRRII